MLGGLILDLGGVLTEPDSGQLLDVVAAVRQRGMRVAILSNSDGVGDLDARLFDDVLLAGDIGFGKPDIRIYLLAADRLGLTPEQCVFVDDVPAFVQAAVRAGMVGVHHHDVPTTLHELSVLFGGLEDAERTDRTDQPA